MTTRILTGDVRAVLATLLPASVHCVVTSPPYYGLRDYGATGQIGLEPTLAEYLDTMVEVCRAIRRVLRKDGCFFLNIGDSYAGGGRGGNPADSPFRKQATNVGSLVAPSPPQIGIKPKDLMLVPHRLALALQADGWWIRDEIVWAKLNPMPESVTDRCTRAHEFVFMLTKSARYFYDAEAIKEAAQADHPSGNGFVRDARLSYRDKNGARGSTEQWAEVGGTRNKRSVWTLASEPFPDAHFATFPTRLVEPCILAGTSAKGVCPQCGTPWARVIERESRPNIGLGVHPESGGRLHRNPGGGVGKDARRVYETGWRAACRCDAVVPIPATVLDPFGGSGTTGLVADRLGRDCILIDLNPGYADMARDRIAGDAGLFAEVAAE